ncbi:MAG: acyltransferase [Pseudomonas sp.]|uniref:acyltransferase family protein n=1 Tax=Pseudomonas sp. TaxID=306 RepID=UPI0033926DF4
MLISLQALRAVAAWTVVMHHVMQIFFDFKGEGFWGRLFIEKGAVGVDLFFVISGVVIYLSTRKTDVSAGSFLANRVMRIVPAYWFYTVLTALLLVQAPSLLPGQAFEFNHFVQSLFFLPAEHPAGFGLYPTLAVGWTLNYEMLFYLCLALLLGLPVRQRLLALATVLGLMSQVLAPAGLISAFYANPIVFEFLLGVAIGMAYRRGWIGQGVRGPLVVLLGAMAALYHFDSSLRLLHWGLPSAAIVAACLALEPYFSGIRPLKVLGDWSYSVYLLHGLVLSAGFYLCNRFGLPATPVILGCLLVILLAAWLSYQWLEKRLYRAMRARLEPAVTARQALLS